MAAGETGAHSVNNDEHALISGYFGPGALAAWYLMMTSVAVTWTLDPTRRYKFSSDFLAAIAYPIIATGYLITRIAVYPTTNGDDAYLLETLKTLHQDTYCAVQLVSDTQGGDKIMSIHKGSETTTVYAQILAINSALCVLEIFQFMSFVAVMNSETRHYSRMTMRLLHGGIAWCCVAEMVLVSKAWNHHNDGIIFLVLLDMFFCVVVTYCCYTLIVPMLMVAVFIRQWFRGVVSLKMKPLEIFWKAVVFVILLGVAATAYIMFPTRLFFPVSSIDISELDQATALAVGVLTTSYNIYTAWKQSEEGEKVDLKDVDFSRQIHTYPTLTVRSLLCELFGGEPWGSRAMMRRNRGDRLMEWDDRREFFYSRLRVRRKTSTSELIDDMRARP